MDIHKPKPWHGLREFLKEYVTIVVGVLTALGAEQVVVMAHNTALARAAQASIDKEIRLNLGRVAYRLQQEPCVERRLDEITSLVGRWRQDDNAIAPGILLGDPGGIALVQESWQANLNDGHYSHEPEDTQVGQAFFYTAFRVLDDSTRNEYLSWGRLRTLQLGSAYLTKASRPQIMMDLQTARSEARILNNVGLEVLKAAAQHGIAPDRVHAPAIAGSTCQPLSPVA
jgi:hypothetical protein